MANSKWAPDEVEGLADAKLIGRPVVAYNFGYMTEGAYSPVFVVTERWMRHPDGALTIERVK